MRKLMILSALALAACGADGEPVQPSGGIDVTLSSAGAGVGANLGLTKGPLRVGLGL